MQRMSCLCLLAALPAALLVGLLILGMSAGFTRAESAARSMTRSPVCVLAFDGRTGTMIVDAAAIANLEAGDVIRTRYGAHTIALRIERKEHRRDHMYVAMVGVDHVDGDAKRASGAFHLHDDGTVTHFVNHAQVAFDVHGRANARLSFANRRRAMHAP